MGKTFKDSVYKSIRKPMARAGQRIESRRQELRDEAAEREWTQEYMDNLQGALDGLDAYENE